MGHRDVALRYGDSFGDDPEDKQRIDNVSAVAFGAEHLWTASDEKATFERLTRNDNGIVFDKAETFTLKKLFTGFPPTRIDDPTRTEKEADLEGLCFRKGTEDKPDRLWITGSHALTRKNYEGEVTLTLLAKPLSRGNARTLLGCVDVIAGKPIRKSGRMLPLGEVEGSLVSAIRSSGFTALEDATLRPAKENGLDIEGIAVAENAAAHQTKVFLGLRGPVIGPYAIVLEIDVRETESALEIVKPAELPACRPHLIHTAGLGIRDLAWHNDGLAVLTGPTMDMDGPFEIRMAAAPVKGWNPNDTGARTTVLLKELGSKGGTRRPEGIALVNGKVLVVSERKDKDNDPQVLMAEEYVIPALA